MKDKFESILLQLKSNLKSDSVIDALKTDKDKELHDKLINVVNNYYENIELFDKQKDSLQKLLFENANNLLQNTNSGIFSHYLPNYRNYANFLVDNYYKSENNITNISTLSENKKDAIKDILSESISMQTNEEKAKKKLIENIKKNSEYNPDYLSLQAKTVAEMMKNSEYNPDSSSSLSKAITEIMKNSDNHSILLKAIDDAKLSALNYPNNPNFEKIIKEDKGFTVGDGTRIGEIIIKEKEEIEIHKNNIALISSDNPSNENDDCLNTKADINAFAKLVAYKELKPPLAIGLFGKWGSGKSTFMNNLKIKIKELSKDKNTEKIFCEKIAHIEFNAWHYSDSNLWANLMIHIFEELNEFLKPKEINKIENLYLQLESTKEFLKEKEDEKKAIQNKITENKKELIDKLNQKIGKTFKLNQLKDITKLVLEDEYINAEINNIKKDIPYLKDKSIEEIYIKLNYDLNKNTGMIQKFFSFLKNDKQFQIYLIIGIFVVLAMLGVLKYLDIFNKWLTSLVIIPFGMYWHRFKEITSKVSKFVDFYETMKEKNTKDDVELSLLKEEAKLESELIFLEEKISLENKRLEEISFEIEHIKSGKFLTDFIMERANSNDYKQHLGLISLIRNDLKKLNKYLKQPREDAEHKIDRIVLYIDDLDRCSEDKVMNVLEAIHLLLAFDLFVVIVGVDTRWIKKSLESERNLENGKTATATEYLEKIFQIPFHLQNMEENVKKQLVEKLLENDLIKESSETKFSTNSSLENQSNSHNFDSKKDSGSDDMPSNSQEDLYKDLKIAQYEYDYILEVAKLLGESPRTIKRFVNIYRLIRSHEYVLKELLTNFEERYKFITMLLCLNDKDDELNVNNYLQKLKELDFAEKDKEEFEKFTMKDDLFKFISRFSFRDCK